MEGDAGSLLLHDTEHIEFSSNSSIGKMKPLQVDTKRLSVFSGITFALVYPTPIVRNLHLLIVNYKPP